MPKQQPLKWSLPQIVHPEGTLCFQVNVPNEPAYIGAFYGAMFLLTKPYAWADDPAHTALEVGRVWRDIFYDLKPGGCVPFHPAPGSGFFQEDFMPIRVDCDCNVFVTCCDGTEKQILTADQVRAIAGGQPGAGAEQPTPGGGCVTYPATVPAQGGWYLPTVVSTGDTIEFQDPGSAWYGGSVTWYCPNGNVFFAGLCTSAEQFNAGSQIPASPIGRAIILLDGTYYDVFDAGTFTVPSGISNAPVTIIMNTDTPSTASGQITLNVKVCNNQLGSWAHTIDMVLTPGGWSTRDLGVWSPGVGYVDTLTSPLRSVDIQFLNSTPFTLKRLAFTANDTPGVGAVNIGIGRNTPGSYIVTPAIVSGVHLYDTGPISLTGTTNLYIDNIIGNSAPDPGGSGVITQVIVEGEGFDPFA